MNYQEPMAESRHQLGRNVKRLRSEQRLSQAQLGLMVGRDRSFISRIERGRCNVTLDTIIFLASGFGITPSQLLAGIGETGQPLDDPLPVTLSVPRPR